MGTLILNSLEIRNFRGFRHLQIERLGRINLIVGKNNVGKTSLLEALQLYAHKTSAPTFIWEILAARNEIKQPFVTVEDMLSTLKYLFYGRKDIRPGLEQIQIGPLHSPDDMLSIAMEWSIVEIGKNEGQSTRPLKPEEYNTSKNVTSGFAVQVNGQVLNYPIDPSLTQRIFTLNTRDIPCSLVSANGLNIGQISKLWDGIALTNQEKEVLVALRLIAPGVEDLSLVSTPASKGERVPIVKVTNLDDPLLLSSLGDGMQRLLGITLALVNAKDGMLLIDEFENGLYYSAQPDLWRFIFRLAHHLNVQVFATTHSWDCIEAFQEAAQENKQEEGVLIRLSLKKDGVKVTLFDEEELGIATSQRIEVR